MNENPAASPDLQSAPPPAEVRLSVPASIPTVTYAILGLTVGVYILQLISLVVFGAPAPGLDWLELYGARINELIRAGQIWRFITPALLHGSIPHIAFNMYALFSFGASLERHFGHARFLCLYVLAAFSGNVLSFIFGSDAGYSVGASTAIFGLVAAEGVFLFQNRALFGRRFGRAIGNIIFVVAINLGLGGLATGIDNWGHIGGLLGGLIFAWFSGPVFQVEGIYPDVRLQDMRGLREIVTGAGAVVLIFGALAAWGMIAPITR